MDPLMPELTPNWPLQALEGLPAEREDAWGKWLAEYRAQLKAEGRSAEERQREQNSANPCYVPRNQVMQEAIREAEAGSFQEVGEMPLTPAQTHVWTCLHLCFHLGHSWLQHRWPAALARRQSLISMDTLCDIGTLSGKILQAADKRY